MIESVALTSAQIVDFIEGIDGDLEYATQFEPDKLPQYHLDKDEFIGWLETHDFEWKIYTHKVNGRLLQYICIDSKINAQFVNWIIKANWFD